MHINTATALHIAMGSKLCCSSIQFDRPKGGTFVRTTAALTKRRDGVALMCSLDMKGLRRGYRHRVYTA